MNFLTPKEKKKLNDLIKQYEQLKDSNRADAAKQ
jgi:hypothetical protein